MTQNTFSPSRQLHTSNLLNLKPISTCSSRFDLVLNTIPLNVVVEGGGGGAGEVGETGGQNLPLTIPSFPDSRPCLSSSESPVLRRLKTLSSLFAMKSFGFILPFSSFIFSVAPLRLLILVFLQPHFITYDVTTIKDINFTGSKPQFFSPRSCKVSIYVEWRGHAKCRPTSGGGVVLYVSGVFVFRARSRECKSWSWCFCSFEWSWTDKYLFYEYLWCLPNYGSSSLLLNWRWRSRIDYVLTRGKLSF